MRANNLLQGSDAYPNSLLSDSCALMESRVGTVCELKSIACFFAFSYGEFPPSFASSRVEWRSVFFWKGTQSVAKTAFDASNSISSFAALTLVALTNIKFFKHANA